MKKILLCAPLKRDPKIFDAYQDALDELVVPEGFQMDRFYIVNDCPEVIQHIRNAAYITYDSAPDEYQEQEHVWPGGTVWKMMQMRNMTIQMMLAGGYDYWFSVDTDEILNRHTLEYLLAANKDIVGEIMWTDGPDGPWCNCWMYDDGDTDKRWNDWIPPGLYQVGGIGGLLLVKRRVFEAGVGYARIPNIRKAVRGEDKHFCLRAACAGFDMFIDTHVPAIHLFGEREYKDYMNMKAGEQHAAGVQESPADHDNGV